MNLETPAFVGQIVVSFMAIAIVLAGAIAWLAQRDQARSGLAAKRLAERRRRRREKSA